MSDDDDRDDDNDIDNQPISKDEVDSHIVLQKKKRKLETNESSVNRKKQSSKLFGIDDEAEGSDDEDEEEEEEEEEDDDGNYVADGFVVPDAEDENAEDDNDSDDSDEQDEDDAGDDENHLQRLKRRKGDLQLDEDDMMLIKDHQTSNNNPDYGDDEDDEDDNDDNEINPIQVIEDRNNTILSEKNTSHRRTMYGNDDDSDMDDFIVYDEDDENQDDQQQQSTARPRAFENEARDRKSGRRDGPSFEQLREANDIFGEGYDDFDDDDEDDDDVVHDGANGDQRYDDDDNDYHARKPVSAKGEGAIALSKKDKKRMEKLRRRYERSQLVNAFYTERDDEIRRIDKPERMQERLQGGEAPQAEERAIEAKWMAMKLAAKMVADNYNHETSKHYDFEQEQKLREELEEPILAVLQFFHVEQYEVPFVWAYRRDYLHPSMTRAHLWQLFLMEEDWDKLYSMKRRLVREIRAIADAAEMTGSVADNEVLYARILLQLVCIIIFNSSCFAIYYRLLLSSN